MLARLDAAARAAQVLAERELGARAVERAAGVRVQLERGREVPLASSSSAHKQRAAVLGGRQRPRRAAACATTPTACRATRARSLSAPARTAASIRSSAARSAMRRPRDLARGDERLVGLPAAELEHQERPARGVADVHAAGARAPSSALSAASARHSSSSPRSAASSAELGLHVRDDLVLARWRASLMPSSSPAAAAGHWPLAICVSASRGSAWVSSVSAPVSRAKPASRRFRRCAAHVVAEEQPRAAGDQQQPGQPRRARRIGRVRQLERGPQARAPAAAKSCGEERAGAAQEVREEPRDGRVRRRHRGRASSAIAATAPASPA